MSTTNNLRKSIKFVIATDVHLGHKQNHPVRKNDSFNAFQQVLSISTQQKVDFLLLGGDLFDQVNPSQKTIYKCLDILQYYVQGETMKSLHAKWLDNPEYKINFSNQNVNIKLPIFTIHGNHDYPSNDFGKISICDLLHVSNYANYFGKHTSLNEIIIKPLVIEKQGMGMKIAVYGLGYIKDNVLNQLFEKGKVKFHELQNRQEYFCLFIFHQNRYKKGLKAGAPALKCINAKHIPAWMDLTIWGHQHEAISKIEIEDERKIFQPGSTVITSFIQAQAYPKQCLMIEITPNGEIDLRPIPLQKSYRPMICRNYEIDQLSQQYKKKSQGQFDFYSYMDNELNQIIEQSEIQFPSKKPIVRVKIQYSGYEITRCKMLELKYSQKVANSQSIMSFWKRKEEKPKNDKELFQAFRDKKDINLEQKEISDEILLKYLQSQSNKQLYFDPREVFKHQHVSIQKDLNNPKDYINGFFNKQIERKSRPINKELQNIYKTTVKQTDVCVKNKIHSILKGLELNGEQNKSFENINDRPKRPETSMRFMWQEQKKILLFKQSQIASLNLLQNFGENLGELESKTNNYAQTKIQAEIKLKQKKEKQSELMSMRVPANYVNPQPNKIFKSNQMEIEESFNNRPQIRQSILKKSNIQLSDHEISNDHEEEDCCKRAQRTEYDEGKTKNNFEDANKIVKNNNEKKIKKNPKSNAQTKAEKKKKSVKWSDSDAN